jgi:hypothetical protein
MIRQSEHSPQTKPKRKQRKEECQRGREKSELFQTCPFIDVEGVIGIMESLALLLPFEGGFKPSNGILLFIQKEE